MKATTRRKIFIVTVLAAIIILLIYGFMPKPAPVDAVAVSRGPLRVTIEEEGKTRVTDRFVLSAPVMGFMKRIQLKVGDTVKKEQPVARLEPLRSPVLDPRSRAEAKASVSAAQEALHSAEENARAAATQAEYSKKNLERLKTLFDSGYLSKDQMDQSITESKRTEANRLSAEASKKAALFNLERERAALGYENAKAAPGNGAVVEIRSPVEGRILKLYHESEGVVSSGEPLIDIGDPGRLEVKVEVLSADAVNIKPGTKVLFERWGGDSPLEGTVRIVEPTAFTKVSSLGVEEQRVLVIADITSPRESWQRLGDSYRVDASFIIWEKDNILQIPASSLFRQGTDWTVFVIKNKTAHLRKVTVGHRNGLTAEITSGLTEGESVITHPEDSVRDGVRVKVRR